MDKSKLMDVWQTTNREKFEWSLTLIQGLTSFTSYLLPCCLSTLFFLNYSCCWNVKVKSSQGFWKNTLSLGIFKPVNTLIVEHCFFSSQKWLIVEVKIARMSNRYSVSWSMRIQHMKIKLICYQICSSKRNFPPY